MSKQILFICYPKCTTCQKAKAFLTEKGISFIERNIKEVNPSEQELKEWCKRSGKDVNKFFNTSGMLYRDLSLKDKLPSMTEEEKFKLLATDGMLVKRPLLITEEKVLVGFKQKDWEEI